MVAAEVDVLMVFDGSMGNSTFFNPTIYFISCYKLSKYKYFPLKLSRIMLSSKFKNNLFS